MDWRLVKSVNETFETGVSCLLEVIMILEASWCNLIHFLLQYNHFGGEHLMKKVTISVSFFFAVANNKVLYMLDLCLPCFRQWFYCLTALCRYWTQGQDSLNFFHDLYSLIQISERDPHCVSFLAFGRHLSQCSMESSHISSQGDFGPTLINFSLWTVTSSSSIVLFTKTLLFG